MMDNKVTRAYRMYKDRGVKGVAERLGIIHGKNHFLRDNQYLLDTTKVPLNKEDFERLKDSDQILINWVIPEPGRGSGGHTTIFRFISHLENMGFHSRIYLFRAQHYRHDSAAFRAFLADAFPLLDSRVEAFWDVSEMKFAHITFATAWDTAYYVRNFDNTICKCYFVQDFEPYFFPKGSYSELAENTYRFGLHGVTAGDWLKEVCRDQYGMDAESFLFSYDKKCYKPRKKRDTRPRVFFYARPVTPRRDFEIGVLALQELCRRIPETEVLFAGWDLKDYEIPFRNRSLGILTPQQLSKAYSQSDLCLVLSNTNLSLVPLEIMASNSVAVCSKGRNSDWLVSEENSILVDYDPVQIAGTLEYYLTHPDELAAKRKEGMAFAKTNTSWEREAEKVSGYLRTYLEADKAKMAAEAEEK